MLLSVVSRIFGKRAPARDLPLEELADEELMLAFGAGEQEAFPILLKRHEGALFRFILRFVSNRSLAEELSQEVFLRVIKAAPRYSKKAKFKTWLYTIARNLCIDHIRRVSGKSQLSIDAPLSSSEDESRTLGSTMPESQSTMASSELVRSEFREKLQAALDELPGEQREVFTLREFGGLKFREIADVVGIPENTVKSRMRYALQTLRGHLAAYRGYSFDADESADARHLR